MRDKILNFIPKISAVLIDILILFYSYNFINILFALYPQFATLQYDQIFLVGIMFCLYYFIVLFGLIITMGLFNLHRKIKYLVLIVPIPFTIFTLEFLSAKGFNEFSIAIIGSIVYVVLTIITLQTIREISSLTLAFFFGKKEFVCCGDDFNNISIYNPSFQMGELDSFIDNILIKFLGYEHRNIKTVTVKDTKYEVQEYARKMPNRIIETQVLLLTKLKLEIRDNIKNIEEREFIEEYSTYSDKSKNIELSDLYDLYQIYQFYDDGESLSHCQSEGEVSLALSSLLPSYANVYVHKDVDVTPP